MGKVTQWKLCKKLTFHHTNKWYMHKPESVLENETHKILWDLALQTDRLVPARKPDLFFNLQEKRTYHIEDFAQSEDHRVKEKGS